LLTDLHIVVDAFNGSPVDNRTNIHLWIKSVAESQFFGALGERFFDLAGDSLLDDQAACRCAALSAGAEGCPEGRFGDEVKIGVVHDDNGILAAHLE
jgi:hypothetical protein